MLRSLAWVIVLVFLVPLVPGQVESPWQTWIRDAEGDAVVGDAGPVGVPNPDARADITEVAAYVEGGRLHIRFETASTATQPLDPDYMSNVWFVIEAPGAGARSLSIRATPDGFTPWAGDEDLSGAWGTGSGSVAWDYEFWIRVDSLLPAYNGTHVVLRDPDIYTWSGMGTTDTAEGGPIGLAPDGGEIVGLAGSWLEVEGVDFAGGTSVAYAPDGSLHLAYYVYRDDRGSEIGIYHAQTTPDGTWTAGRIGDFVPAPQDEQTAETRDAQTRTAITVGPDGEAHILVNRCPTSSCTDPWTYFSSATGWDPEPLAAGYEVLADQRAKADLTVRGGRVVAAVPLQGDGLVVLERDGSGWTELHRLDDARLPKLDADDQVHVAFFRVTDEDNVDRGEVIHAASPAWEETVIVDAVRDQSAFWDIEVDGSFAFALDPEGRPAFVWDRSTHQDGLAGGLPERGFGRMVAGSLVAEEAPLAPSHGNPNLALRLGFDAAGNAHVGAGYGGTDTYAMRSPDGTWYHQEIPRHDVWDMAVRDDGQVAFGYTQPHGGTTVAASFLMGALAQAEDGSDVQVFKAERPAAGDSGSSIGFIAFGAAVLLVGGLVGIAAAQVHWVRRQGRQ